MSKNNLVQTIPNVSIDSIRADLLLKALKSLKQTDTTIRVAATGRTGSGKTTLGRWLIGIGHYLPQVLESMASTGQQNCTSDLHLLKLNLGLQYVDLPGVASNDRLENYNRVALGLPQVPEWEQVEKVKLYTLMEGVPNHANEYTTETLPQQALRPDVILYIIAPKNDMGKSEFNYIVDVLSHYGEKVVFILNSFSNNGVKVERPEQCQGIRNEIRRAAKKAKIDFEYISIVEVDCLRGYGIDTLLSTVQATLPDDRGDIFDKAIQHQITKTPDEYILRVQRELATFSHQFIAQKHDPNGSNQLRNSEAILKQWAETMLAYPVSQQVVLSNAIEQLYQEVITDCQQPITEDYRVWRTRPIYEKQQQFKTVTEWQTVSYTDYELRWVDADNIVDAIGSIFNERPGKVRQSVPVTRTRRVSVDRQVPNGFKRVKVGEEDYPVWRTRVTGYYYNPYDMRATSFFISCAEATALCACGELQNQEVITSHLRSRYALLQQLFYEQGITAKSFQRFIKTKKNLQTLFSREFTKAIKRCVFFTLAYGEMKADSYHPL